jgi:ribosomal protein S18 acetylase RimI-like enzyme
MLTTREAREEDALEVADLHVRAWQVAYRGLLPAERLDSMRAEERATRYSFGSTEPGAPETILAVCERSIWGFATVLASRDEDSPGAGELSALYVDPHRWGQGTGRLLTAEAYARLRARGFQEAVLWVLVGNDRAERFYRTDGWRHDGSRRRERMWDVEVDVVRYRRKLD